MGQIIDIKSDSSLSNFPERPLSMHPKKFALWLFICTVIMIFGALTSAFIVRKADGNWLEFELPVLLWVNTIIILFSSATLQWSYFSAKRDNINNLKIGIAITFFLGILFVIGQFYAWKELVSMGVYFGGSSSNPSGSFIYVLTGLHALHLVSGIIFLLFVLVASFQYKVHSKNMVRIEMCATYWHFLDFLWIYLFGFLILNN
ncbi:MAG: heme-copper oxidase subunit III [Cytophagales bacterium]|nr:MAG: heme-copper oxidase subunit III [Cytophagales bacterium]